ncbi:MAG: hypothetical protein L0Y80_09805 [Ignavibacteriae bacterium]|nr:hypothetical protein [Ignavibacteriota bacterium]
MRALSLFTSLLATSFAACLPPTDVPREPNIFSLSITIPDAGEKYVVGNDTITVIAYKMLIDSIGVRKQEGDEERFEPSLRLASYVIGGLSDYYTIGAGSIGSGTFNGIRYAIIRPPFETTLNDPDLVERDQTTQMVTDTYSLSVSGIYNGNLFRFRSKVSGAVMYGFLENVQLPEVNGFLEVRLRGNWKQWFTSLDGNSILDPNNSNNRSVIEANILMYFDTFTFTVSEAQ